MRQVNITISDDTYKEIVKIAGKKQAELGQRVSVTRITTELVNEALKYRRNGNRAHEPDRVQDKEQDSKQEGEQESNKSNDYFADLNF